MNEDLIQTNLKLNIIVDHFINNSNSFAKDNDNKE